MSQALEWDDTQAAATTSPLPQAPSYSSPKLSRHQRLAPRIPIDTRIGFKNRVLAKTRLYRQSRRSLDTDADILALFQNENIKLFPTSPSYPTYGLANYRFPPERPGQVEEKKSQDEREPEDEVEDDDDDDDERFNSQDSSSTTVGTPSSSYLSPFTSPCPTPPRIPSPSPSTASLLRTLQATWNAPSPGPFLVIKAVHTGAASVVYAARELSHSWSLGMSSGRVLCLKVCDKNVIQDDEGKGMRAAKAELNAYQILEELKAERERDRNIRTALGIQEVGAGLMGADYVMTLQGALEDEERLFFAMELMDTDLATILGRGPEWYVPHRKRWIGQTALGISFIHSCGIIHRDIKPENLLITSHTFNIRIAEFGVSWSASTKSSPASLSQIREDLSELSLECEKMAEEGDGFDIPSTPTRLSSFPLASPTATVSPSPFAFNVPSSPSTIPSTFTTTTPTPSTSSSSMTSSEVESESSHAENTPLHNWGAYTDEVVGSWAYMAPEVLDNYFKPVQKRVKYGTGVDWWALGCIIFELEMERGLDMRRAARKAPRRDGDDGDVGSGLLFEREEEVRDFQRWCRSGGEMENDDGGGDARAYLQYAGLNGDDVEDLVAGLLRSNPSTRFTLPDLFRHPYFEREDGNEFDLLGDPSPPHPADYLANRTETRDHRLSSRSTSDLADESMTHETLYSDSYAGHNLGGVAAPQGQERSLGDAILFSPSAELEDSLGFGWINPGGIWGGVVEESEDSRRGSF